MRVRGLVLTLAVLLLGLVGAGVASADTPEVRAPDAPAGFREIGNGRFGGSSVDYSTEEPQLMTGDPPINAIGYGACIQGEEGIYYTAQCAEWGEWDPWRCHNRFWCKYVTPPDGMCSGFPVRTEAWWSWSDESQLCQQDPESGEVTRVVCRDGYRLVYHGYTHYCVKQWWHSGSSPETVCGVGYITIIGSAKTADKIAKQWNGNYWDHPQYMGPAAVEPGEPQYWYVQYIVGPGPASFSLVERGEDRGQDQRPIWTIEVEVLAGEHQEVVAYDEELRFPEGS